MQKHKLTSLILLACLILPLAAQASTTMTALDFQLNKDLQGSDMTNGSFYQAYWGEQTFNGVKFNLRSENGKEAWQYTGNKSGTLKVTANLYGVTEVHTLINSMWGSKGSNLGSISFVGKQETYKVDLIAGVLVRDHYNNPSGFTDELSALDRTDLASYVREAVPCSANKGNVRLDMQTFVLPASFATDMLVSIDFTFKDLGNPDGRPFLAGVSANSTNPVPIPAAAWLLGSGLLGLIGLRKKAGL